MPHYSADRAQICLTTLQEERKHQCELGVARKEAEQRRMGRICKVESKESTIVLYLTTRQGEGGLFSTRKASKQDLEASSQA